MAFCSHKNQASLLSRPLFSLLTLMLASTTCAEEKEAGLSEVVVSSTPLGELPEAGGTVSRHLYHGTHAAAGGLEARVYYEESCVIDRFLSMCHRGKPCLTYRFHENLTRVAADANE